MRYLTVLAVVGLYLSAGASVVARAGEDENWKMSLECRDLLKSLRSQLLNLEESEGFQKETLDDAREQVKRGTSAMRDEAALQIQAGFPLLKDPAKLTDQQILKLFQKIHCMVGGYGCTRFVLGLAYDKTYQRFISSWQEERFFDEVKDLTKAEKDMLASTNDVAKMRERIKEQRRSCGLSASLKSAELLAAALTLN